MQLVFVLKIFRTFLESSLPFEVKFKFVCRLLSLNWF